MNETVAAFCDILRVTKEEIAFYWQMLMARIITDDVQSSTKRVKRHDCSN